MGLFGALRGLFAACLVGRTLFEPDPARFGWLKGRVLRYIAEVSYALYVIHPATVHGWFDSGPKLVRYSKRILSFALTFGLAHLSRFHFENHLLDLGRKLARRIEKPAAEARRQDSLGAPRAGGAAPPAIERPAVGP